MPWLWIRPGFKIMFRIILSNLYATCADKQLSRKKCWRQYDVNVVGLNSSSIYNLGGVSNVHTYFNSPVQQDILKYSHKSPYSSKRRTSESKKVFRILFQFQKTSTAEKLSYRAKQKNSHFYGEPNTVSYKHSYKHRRLS